MSILVSTSFRTEYIPSPSPLRLTPRSPLLMLGSCFAGALAARLREAMWDVEANPCGVLFNPASIAASVRGALSGAAPDVHQRDARWLSWDFPGEFSRPTAEAAAVAMTAARVRLRDALMRCGAMVVTLGTAIVYELQADGRIVTNCHKAPASVFRRRMLGVGEIVAQWRDLLGELRALRPGLPVIITLSPVRHVREGFESNSLSKATLRVAMAELCVADPELHYFPAFEIFNDDLRDYRFCAPDMAHPTPEAETYIVGKFLDTYVDTDAQNILSEALALRRRLNHRPLYPDSPAAAAFAERTRADLAGLLRRHPYLRP